MSSPKDFYTRAASNEGVRLPLDYPDGTPSGEWLLILGVDSDAFVTANDAEMRKLAELAKDSTKEEREAAYNESRLRLLSVLIGGWSFTEELTREAAIEFLREAPYIAKGIDKVAARRKLYFKKPSVSS